MPPMFDVLLSVLCTVALFVLFRFFKIWKVDTFQAIMANYAACLLFGITIIYTGENVEAVFGNYHSVWPWALAVGTLFIVTFNLMAVSVARVGVNVTTIASKMSFVIPTLLGILITGTNYNQFNLLNYAGLGIALVAVVLSSVKKEDSSQNKGKVDAGWLLWFLPAVVFINSGLADSLIGYANGKHIAEHQQPLFTMLIFGAAFVLGLFALVFGLVTGKIVFQARAILAGVLLGIPNYLSMYFLLRALRIFNNDGAFLFPVINILTIGISALAALVFFNERPTKLNMLGLALAILAIILVSWQELVGFLA